MASRKERWPLSALLGRTGNFLFSPLMQPTYMRCVTFSGKSTSGSRISANRSDFLKLPDIDWQVLRVLKYFKKR